MSSLNSKILIVSVVFLIIGLILGYAVGSYVTPAPTPEETVVGLKGEVPIGVLLPLTGPLSTYAENSETTLQLAKTEVNQWLQSIGADWHIELYVEDTAVDPKTTFDKLQTLHGNGIKIFIGPMASPGVSEIKNYVDSNGLLVISQSSTAVSLSVPGDNVFRFCPDDTVQGPAMAKVLWERGVRWIVPMWRGNTWGDGLKESAEQAFNKVLQDNGAQGGVDQGVRYDPNTKEFSTEVATLADKVQQYVDSYGADKVGVLYIGFEEVVAVFTAAKNHPILEQVAWEGSDGTAGTASLIKEAEAAGFAVNTEFLNTIFAPSGSTHLEKVKNYVKSQLGRQPDSYAYVSYDILWVIALGLNVVDKYDPMAVKKVIPTVVSHYNGASGTFELNENGDRAFSDYELWAVRSTDNGYVWDVAGLYKGDTGEIIWKDWWIQLHT